MTVRSERPQGLGRGLAALIPQRGSTSSGSIESTDPHPSEASPKTAIPPAATAAPPTLRESHTVGNSASARTAV